MTTDRLHLPPWVVLHVPHDSAVIPDDVRSQFLLDGDELRLELVRMTDHLTHALFVEPGADVLVVRAPVSRLVVDVERFPEDADEPMAARGMGAVCLSTSQCTPLRRPLPASERESLMRDLYRPHHARLEAAVASALALHGRCLVVDCHSIPSEPLPYERADPKERRPEICIGTDAFHTDARLADAFVRAFEAAGWRVARGTPFAGAIVPASRYWRDPRVAAVMVEVNRQMYCDESTGTALPAFGEVASRIRRACVEAVGVAVQTDTLARLSP